MTDPSVLDNILGPKPIPGKKPNSVLDSILSKPSSPDQNAINNFGGTDDVHENDDSFGHTLGSFVDYLGTSGGSGLTNKTGPSTNDPVAIMQARQQQMNQRDALSNSALSQVGSNIKSDVVNAFNYYKNTSFDKIANDTMDYINSPSDNKGSMLSGLFKGIIEKPIETLTQSTNDNGTARPATVQEQAQNLQASAALVAQIAIFKNMGGSSLVDGVAKESSMLDPLAEGPIGDVGAATGKLQSTRLGPIALSGGLKQGAKYLGREVLAGSVAGGVGGAISGIGQDNQADQIISGALSFIPLSAAFGLLGVKGYVSNLTETRNRLQNIETTRGVQDIAALNSLRINPSDPISTLLSNTDAVKSGDNLTKAAIRSRLEVNDGYIVEGVSPALGDQLGSGATPSSKPYPDNYVAPKALNKPRPRPNSTEVKFDSDFDKLAYLAAAKKPSPFVSSLVDDAVNQTGLTPDEIISHGKYVRKQQLAGYRTGKLIPRSQPEIDAYNNASLENGRSIANALPEGNSIKDSEGNTWTRVGNSIKNSDGSQVLPLDQNNTLQIIGRKKSDTPFYQPYQQLGKQTFNPNFDRFSVNKNLPDVNYYHSPANNSLLVTPLKYTPDAINFFKQSGYMKGEVVSFEGYDQTVVGMDEGKVTLKNVNNGRINFADPSEIRRTNYSITPELVSKDIPIYDNNGLRQSGGLYPADANGVVNPPMPDWLTKRLSEPGLTDKQRQTIIDESHYKNPPTGVVNRPIGVKAPVLDPSSLVQRLYPQFLKGYLESPEDQSFAGFTQKFYSSLGIGEKDYNHISSVFTKNLADDLANKTLEPEELSTRNRLMAEFNQLKSDQITNHANWLSRQAEQNGLFYSPEGGGKYRLSLQESGKTIGIVGSPDEALKVINSMRQVQGLPLDGGYSGSVPPGIGNIGGLSGGYTPVQYGKIQQFMDLSRVTGMAKIFTPMGRRFQYLDNLANNLGIKTQFFPKFLQMQEALMNRNNIVGRDPGLLSLKNNMQNVIDFGSGISSTRREVIADNLDTGSIDDIKNRYLARPATSIEDNLAQEMAKTNVGAVQDLLFKAKTANPNASFGGQAYMTTLQQLGQTVDPSVLKSANMFATLVSKSSQDILSGDLVLRLAHAYEDPTHALSQMDHTKANNLTARELQYGQMVKNAFNQAASVAGIDDKATYQMYLPSLIRRYAVGNGDLVIPEGFAREMSRVGITPKNVLIRDPNELLNKYFIATVNHLSGFNDSVSQFQDAMTQNVQMLKGSKLEPITPTLGSTLDQYVKSTAGYKSVDDNLYSAGKRVAASLGLSGPSLDSVISLQSLGILALKPMLAVRDFLNIMGLSYASFGREFTQRAFADAISPEYVKDMIDRNIMPDDQTRSIMDPGVDETSMIQGKPWLRKWSNAGFRLSGQEFAYQHANAGVYKASMDMAEKYFGQLKDGKINKEQAFSKLGIKANYGPGLVQQIDDLLTQGRPDKAADLYAQANMRTVSHIYGYNNNPQGWEGKTGRLLSQWGSWSANASNTMLDQMSRGSKMEIAGKLSRVALFDLALTHAGSALGFNLKSWTVSNPLNIWPTTGPIVNLPSQISDAYNQGKGPSSVFWHEVEGFFPYSGAASNWVDALGQIGQGNLIQGLGKAAGAPLIPGNNNTTQY